MDTFKLIGSIIPSGRYNINTSDLPSVSYKIPTIEETIKCNVQIEQSKVVATCEVNEYKQSMLGWYLNYITDIARAVVNLVGFSLTDSLDVSFDEVSTPSGERLKINQSNFNPDLRKLCTAFSLDGDKFGSALRVVMKEPNLFLALADIIPNLRPGTQDISACYRAIERLRNMLSPDIRRNKSEERSAWGKLRDTLNLSEEFITSNIYTKVKSYRHGHLKPLTPKESSEILKGTWQIVNRFIAYRMGNSKPLSKRDFPIL